MSIPVLKLVAKADSDLVVARHRAHQIASLAGMNSLQRSRLVTAVSEIVRNSLTYAGEARIEFGVANQGSRQYVEVIVSDSGDGAPSSTKPTIKDGRISGLSISKVMLDDFHITSEPDGGSKATLLKAVGATIARITPATISDWIIELKRNSPFSAVEDLEQQNKQLIDTLEEVEKYRAKLEEKSEQLNQAVKYKAEFLANMSHEIRTPMNAVLGMSTILERTELNAEQKKYLRLIKDAGTSLLDIINGILDFSKIEAGKLTLENTEFELFDQVESCVELLSTHANSKGLALLSWMDPLLPKYVTGDSLRLRQILVNLTNNAIKFTATGEVIVRVSLLEETAQDALIRFEVTDSGIGISDEQVAKLFQPFVQADGSTTRKFGGSGLGLSICRQLVELMKGKIGVDSVPGVGSTFWFELPLSVSRSGKPKADAAEIPFKKALIVDNHAAMREMASHLLSSWNLENETAESAQEALELIKKKDFDLFILDYLMPEMDGLELTAKLRSTKSCKDSYIVLLTALHQSGLGEKAISEGCDAFLTKPVRQGLLLECLTSLKNMRKSDLRQSRIFIFDREKERVKALSSPLSPTTENPAEAETAPEHDTVHSHKLLLVEDNPTNQIVAGIELRNLGLELDIASDGEEALKLLSANAYAAIFMDCQMPVMDGYECTKQIRINEAITGKHIPIIAMTANAMQGDREKCLSTGMDDYISKPFDPEKLKALVKKWLKKVQDGSESSDATDSKNIETTETVTLDYEKLSSKFNEAQAKQLLNVFIDDTGSKLAQMTELVSNKDCDELSKLAHGIKGAASMIFADSLAITAKELEMAGKAGESERLAELAMMLTECFEEFKAFCKDKV